MDVKRATLDGVLVIRPPTVFEDFRGTYVEAYNRSLYQEAGIKADFVQDDYSCSSQNVLRGIHGDGTTWKLISCMLGRMYVVVVDARSSSPQYRKWEAFTLSEESKLQVLVPPGFGVAHLVLSERAIFNYKQSTYYDRATQFTLQWNDPSLNIWWPVAHPIVSRRDSGIAGV